MVRFRLQGVKRTSLVGCRAGTYTESVCYDNELYASDDFARTGNAVERYRG